MNLRVQMVDTDTGEILGTRYGNYALNFQTRNDAGFLFLLRWIQSCVRGVRIAGHNNLELNIHFSNDTLPSNLFNGVDREEFNERAGAFLV